MPREQLRLKVWHEPEWCRLFQEGMASLLLLAFGPSGQYRLAAIVGQQDGSPVTGLEIS